MNRHDTLHKTTPSLGSIRMARLNRPHYAKGVGFTNPVSTQEHHAKACTTAYQDKRIQVRQKTGHNTLAGIPAAHRK